MPLTKKTGEAAYRLYGWELSYFTGKVRAYLRFKDIPFDEKPVDALTLLWRVPRRTGATVMPVVVTPEGDWLQDSKHIADVLEARYPDVPVTPQTPRQRIAARLLELWADEFWIPPAMHYRWSYPENYALFEREAGAALLPRAPGLLQRRIAANIAGRLRGYLPTVGVVPAQLPLIERWTQQMLDALERHFAALPFLFGSRPSIADFALYGPLYAHLARDPAPRRLLLAPRPRLQAWVDRMTTPAPQAGAFLDGDALPATLQPLLDSVFDECLPMLGGIRDALQAALPQLPAGGSRLPRALGTVEFPYAGERFARAAMPYSLWMLQRVLDDYRALAEAERGAVDAWLATQSAQAQTAMRFEIGARLRRRGLHVALEAPR